MNAPKLRFCATCQTTRVTANYRCTVCESPVRLYPVRVRLHHAERPAGAAPLRISAELGPSYLQLVHPPATRAA
jgi:hypothetical protein